MGRRKHTVLGIVGIVAAALVVATLSLMGCGGGGDSSIKLTSETPSGFKTHNVEGMSLAVPKDWKVEKLNGRGIDAKIKGTSGSVGAMYIEEKDTPVYVGKSLDKDVEKYVKSSKAKSMKVKSSAKGKDGSAVIYRYELEGKTVNGDQTHAYWQYTFSGDGYYEVMASIPEDDFSKNKDDILAVLNSQKLSDPEAPEKVE